ncbi:MAG TPA: hypothetical protein VLA95_00230 [Gemmatimonadales bacterium]|nr:hypothetical protein [Gemmatimonadales bacterium]
MRRVIDFVLGATLAGIVAPLAGLLPAWLPADHLLSLLLVLLIALLIGASALTRAVHTAKEGPAFIIEEHADGRYTVFVPSVPTPFAGAVYVLDRARVHPLDVPFTQAIRAVSRWGSGCRELVAGMRA